MIITTRQLIIYPDDGIDGLDSSRSVVSLAPEGPSINKLQKGDTIISYEGIPLIRTEINYHALGKSSGDVIHFIVLRDGKEVPIDITLVEPSRALLSSRLMTILVAFFFLAIGLGVGAFKPSDKGSSIYPLWFYISALALTAGAASTMRLGWATVLFYSSVWILGPISVHFHTLFPQLVRGKPILIIKTALYILGAVGVLPFLLFGPARMNTFSWYPSYLAVNRLFLAANMIIVVGLLVYSYRNADTPGVRGRIRLVLFGAIMTALPFAILTILPEVLFKQPLIQLPFAFLLIGFLPLTYAYAIFRLHFIEVDQKINRGATLILVYSILGGFYLIIYALLNHWLPDEKNTTSLINTTLVLMLATIFIPLHRWVQRFVDRIFYGGWYDYRIGISQITNNLSQITELEMLAQTVSARLVSTLRLEEAVVFLRDQSGDFSVIETSFTGTGKERSRLDFPVLPRSSLTYLMKIGAAERTTLMQELSQVTLTPQELQLLNTEQIHLWIPILGHGLIQGLLALGPKMGGDVFSAEDMDILRVVVQQLSPIIENIHLLTDLKDYASELEKRVEERTSELHEAKERVETILASVGDGVVVIDLDGKILTVNQAFERLSGFSFEEIRGNDLFQLIASENGTARVTSMRDALNNGDIWSDELSGRRKDGGPYNIQFTIAPIHAHQGQVIGYVGSQTDITRQKELERMKDAFISDVSHELRTPITNISLYLELLKSAPEGRHDRFLNVVKEQSELLTKLVEDILDLSRLTASKSRPVAFTNADLNQLTEQVLTAYLPLAEASGVKLTFVPDPTLPNLNLEQNQIARMITNMVANAIRYSPSGEVQVITSCYNGGVCMLVQDTGIGIDPQEIPHLFDRFFRGKNVRQSEMHGTGLGLAIVKEIVDFHGGNIQVWSEVMKGSVFQVWLPLHQL